MAMRRFSWMLVVWVGVSAFAEEKPSKQKQLADDTARLLVMAKELKAEMDKSTKDMLSVSVIRKADEIEKLAKKVREEMKGE
jgi:hypothetical protein